MYRDMTDTVNRMTIISEASPKNGEVEMGTPDTADATCLEDIKVSCKSVTYPPLPSPRLNQQSLKLSLENLPPELLACTLQHLSSPSQLYSAINTSRTLYRAFRSSMVSILASIMEQAIHPAVLPLAILICEEGGDKDGIPARSDGYLHQNYYSGERVRKEGEPRDGAIRYGYFRRKVKEMTISINLGHHNYLNRQKLSNLKLLVPLCRLYSLVDFFIYDYCFWTSIVVQSWVKVRRGDYDDDDGSIEQKFRNFEVEKNTNLSTYEYARLQRAFFWFEIHRRLFSDLEHFGESGWSEEERQNAKFRKDTVYWYMRPTERKQLRSVTAFLIRRMETSYDNLYQIMVFQLLPEVKGRLWDANSDNDCYSGVDSDSAIGDGRDNATKGNEADSAGRISIGPETVSNCNKADSYDEVRYYKENYLKGGKEDSDGDAIDDGESVSNSSKTGDDSEKENRSKIGFAYSRGNDGNMKINSDKDHVESRSERSTKSGKASSNRETGYSSESNDVSARSKDRGEIGDDGENGNHYIGVDREKGDVTQKIGNDGKANSGRENGSSSERANNSSEADSDTKDDSSNEGNVISCSIDLSSVSLTKRDFIEATDSAADAKFAYSLVRGHARNCEHEDDSDGEEAPDLSTGTRELPYSCVVSHVALSETVQKRKKATLLIEAGLPFCRLMFTQHNAMCLLLELVLKYCASRQHWDLDDKAMYSPFYEAVDPHGNNEEAAKHIHESPDMLYPSHGLISSSLSSRWPITDRDGQLGSASLEPAEVVEPLASHVRRHIGYHIWDDGRLDGYRCGLDSAVPRFYWERDRFPKRSDYEIWWNCLDFGYHPDAVRLMAERLTESLRLHQPRLEEFLRQLDYLPLP